MTYLWSLADDRQLVANRVWRGLAPRTEGAVKSRLAHLCNPLHSAYIRLKRNEEELPTHLLPILNPKHTKRKRFDEGEPISSSFGHASEHSSTMGSTLTRGQLEARDAALDPLGGNIFITGGAGVGKSYLIRLIIRDFDELHGEAAVAFTALTSIAALNNGEGRGRQALTLHSFAGIGLADGTLEELIARVLADRLASNRWRRTKVLVVDEVSMLDAVLFRVLDEIAKSTRQSEEPFGGIKLILVGDFLQLPPVKIGAAVQFAFASPVWQSCALRAVLLEEVKRQDEVGHVRMLEELRRGVVTKPTLTALAARHISVACPATETDFENVTHMFCHTAAVDAHNASKLAALVGDEFKLTAEDTYTCADGDKARLLEEMNGMVKAAALSLKAKARVRLVINLHAHKLANGSMGYVQKFENGRVGVLFDNGTQLELEACIFKVGEAGCMLTRTAMPLTLAWAITVHKSQSLSLARACIRVDGAWAPGQVYVAISRVKSLQGLWMEGDMQRLATQKGGRPGTVVADQAAIDFYVTNGLLRALI